MRCVALADELKKQGMQIRFVSHNLPAHLESMLDARGMEYAPLSIGHLQESSDELAHSSWLGNSQNQDAQASIQALADHSWDWVVVDHYSLDTRWESAIRASAKMIMVIDDLADRQHNCDVLLDQNFYSDMQTRYIGKVSVHCQLLLGPRYALLREEFRRLREQVKPRMGNVKRILVFFGGVDVDNCTSLTIEALANINGSQHVDVVIDAQHPYREQVQDGCIAHGYICHVQTMRMAELMAEADLAIGAGGTTTWERCCLGLPAICLCLAENQRKQIADAAEAGLLYSPISARNLIAVIRDHVNSLLENPALIKLVSNAGMKLVDGQGVLNVARVLCFSRENKTIVPEVIVRVAEVSDAMIVWPWRNHEATRRYFFDRSNVSIEAHAKWWNQSIANSSRILLLGVLDNCNFGVVRFDFESITKVVTSIYLNPSMTGRGLGHELLISGLNWLMEHHPQIKFVAAEIFPENQASIRLFQSAGFQESHRTFLWGAPVDNDE